MVTFNAPGVSKATYERYKQEAAELKPAERPEITQYAHELDPVSLAGDKYLGDEVTVVKNKTAPTWRDELNLKNRFLKIHTQTNLQDGDAKFEKMDFNARQRSSVLGDITEPVRYGAGSVGAFAEDVGTGIANGAKSLWQSGVNTAHEVGTAVETEGENLLNMLTSPFKSK
jgi:hypothetical protein